VRHRRGGQPRAHDLDEPVQPGRALGEDGGQGAGRHRRAEHIGEQLAGSVDRQVLVHAQVAHQRAHPRPVAGRRTDRVGERRGGRSPAGTAATLGPVLGHAQAQRRQVEQLPGLDPDHRRDGQVRAAPAAQVRRVFHHLVGLLHLGQVGAGRAGLLARPAALGLLVGVPFGPGGLAQAVRGRRLGGVGGVLTEPTLQLGKPRPQRGDQTSLLSVDRAQLDNHRGLDRDGGFQIGVGGGDRSLQDNERSSPLAMGRTEQLPHTPQTVNSFTARRRCPGATKLL
jgi:hypothetical protein